MRARVPVHREVKEVKPVTTTHLKVHCPVRYQGQEHRDSLDKSLHVFHLVFRERPSTRHLT